MSQRTIQTCLDCGKDTIWEHGSKPCRCYACQQRRDEAQREAGFAPARGSTNHGDWELLNRLRSLYEELKKEERNFHAQDNDEGECAIYAAAERLKEVVQGYLAGEVYSSNSIVSLKD